MTAPEEWYVISLDCFSAVITEYSSTKLVFQVERDVDKKE
jgi:hypothetical protein